MSKSPSSSALRALSKISFAAAKSRRMPSYSERKSASVISASFLAFRVGVRDSVDDLENEVLAMPLPRAVQCVPEVHRATALRCVFHSIERPRGDGWRDRPHVAKRARGLDVRVWHHLFLQ